MRRKLPFVIRIFWKVLATVAILVAIAWAVIVTVTDYEITGADYGFSALSTIIFAYLVHLWLLPEEDSPPDGE